MRTLLLGLDGVCRSVLDPLFDAGVTPTIRSLFEGGVDGTLDSQLPPWTPSAWPSLYTGVNPGKHGVFDFLTFDGYDWDLVDRTDVREHALWELLDRHGLTSVVVNVPVTGPPRPFDGALVPGYISPEDPDCHPSGLLEELRSELGAYRVYPPKDTSDEEAIEWYDRLARMRGEAFRHLAAEHDPEFGFLQFQQTDTVFHERPEDDEAVRTAFSAVDEEVAATLDACDPDTVIVASDHGIGPYVDEEFRVNTFLEGQSYARTTTGEGGMPSWAPLARGDDDRSLARRAVRAAATVGVTSQRLGSLLSALGLADFVLDRVSSETVHAATERVDFASSTAYMRSRTELGVRINVAGREPEGIVSPSEFPAVRADLIEALESVRGPDGDPVFDAVVPSEDVYDGPYVDEAPDVVTVPAGFDTLLSASIRDEQFGEPPGPWNHKPTGVVALRGDAVDADGGLSGAHLFDIAPTVLSTLGVPPGDRMDGEPLPPVAATPPTEYPPFTARDVEGADTERVREQLAGLGYLEDDR